jgi:isovaleryl-CoA dehydrogenase
MHEVRGGTANCKKLRANVEMLTVGEGTENVQRILIAEDALGLNDPNRHPMRNRARGLKAGLY